jgi:hypothetical protein
MARAPSTFRQSDITRAIRAARAAGVDVENVRIEIAKDGRLVIIAGAAQPATWDKLDRELEEFRGRHGQG